MNITLLIIEEMMDLMEYIFVVTLTRTLQSRLFVQTSAAQAKY